ncbi:hypothetical protein PMAC_001051 [Pneumocystis sp. 'macacae']|nr:hypothetical protein PMAC_001051 [Pneumocystis sp. 'macacae']
MRGKNGINGFFLHVKDEQEQGGEEGCTRQRDECVHEVEIRQGEQEVESREEYKKKTKEAEVELSIGVGGRKNRVKSFFLVDKRRARTRWGARDVHRVTKGCAPSNEVSGGEGAGEVHKGGKKGCTKQLVGGGRGGEGEVGRGTSGGTKIRGGEVGGNGDEEQSKETKKVKSERRVGGQKLVENEDEMKNKTGTPKNKEQTQRLH